MSSLRIVYVTIFASSRLTEPSRYVAPERLNNEGFIEMISSIRIRLVAIDEAHCISEWGHAFRPDYLKGNDSLFRPMLLDIAAEDALQSPDLPRK